jgi:ferric-dicitrate binding protein FerR (iron transport regulator)
MTDEFPPPPDDDLERWLREAGARAGAGDDREGRVREAVRNEWRRTVVARTRRRVALWGAAGLAVAASIALSVFLGHPLPGPVAAPIAPVVGRLASVVGDVALTSAGAAPGVATVGADLVAGNRLRTGGSGLTTVSMTGGGELRVDANTTVRFSGARLVALDAGGVYFDSGSAAAGEPIAIETPAGTIRDVGTRFEVRVHSGTTRVRVRDGLVRVDQGGAQRDAGAGVELGFAGDGSVEERRIRADAPAWTWTTRAAPAFVIEGATLGAFLDWVRHESGRAVAFEDNGLARRAAAIVLHGDVTHLTVDQALATVLPTCGLRHRVSDGRILISRAGSGGRP